MEFHINRFAPTKIWPNGGWSLYQITGDQIAVRTGVDDKGKIARRDGWIGYVDCFETLDEVAAAMKEMIS